MSIADDFHFAKSLRAAEARAKMFRNWAKSSKDGDLDYLIKAARIEREIKRLMVRSAIPASPAEHQRNLQKFDFKMTLIG